MRLIKKKLVVGLRRGYMRSAIWGGGGVMPLDQLIQDQKASYYRTGNSMLTHSLDKLTNQCV